MKFHFKHGNLLESRRDALVNTVNCVGVMGKGIALDFKNAYPEMFADYVRRCRREEVIPGRPYIYPAVPEAKQLGLELASESKPGSTGKIINFPTKLHWRSRSRLEDVKAGLEYLSENLEMWNVQSLAIPPLGCGNGGLDWCDVGPMIRKFAESVDIEVDIYVPNSIDPEMPFRFCE